jgi:HK97 gp10 family phage protein
MSFDMAGLDAMKARMAGMAEAVSGPIAHKAVRAGGRVIQEAMIERTPENVERNAGSDSLEPGAVKADIKVRFPADENALEATATIGPGGKTSHVARWVEYGHRMVSGGQSKLGPDGKLRGPGKAAEVDVPADPFLRPAFEASEAPAMDAIAETLATELPKAGV